MFQPIIIENAQKIIDTLEKSNNYLPNFSTFN